ncbi:MAG: hypothetical protein U0412_04335 [Nitrospira sp.]
MNTTLFERSGRLVAGLLMGTILTSGCSTFGSPQRIHQSAKGTVYIEEVSEWSFEANHPTIIDHGTMMRMVKGIIADEAGPTSTKMPASGSKPMRVFSDEDAEFLAPLLAQGLSHAKPEQIVGFRVSSSAGSGAEPTAGTLYIQNGAAYFTIASPKSLKGVGFMPYTASRIEAAPSYAANGNSAARSIVIDYPTLARGPMASPTSVATPSKALAASQPLVSPAQKAVPKQEPPTQVQLTASSTLPSTDNTAGTELTADEFLNKKLDELRQAREANTKKDSEISMLRKETEWMKQALRERTAQLNALKASKVSGKPAPKKNTAEVQPSK